MLSVHFFHNLAQLFGVKVFSLRDEILAVYIPTYLLPLYSGRFFFYFQIPICLYVNLLFIYFMAAEILLAFRCIPRFISIRNSSHAINRPELTRSVAFFKYGAADREARWEERKKKSSDNSSKQIVNRSRSIGCINNNPVYYLSRRRTQSSRNVTVSMNNLEVFLNDITVV